MTATDAFYVRGHGAVPEIDPDAWRLRVHGLVERELELSPATLREAFRERTVTATLQCAGNRRSGLMRIRDIPGEAPWGAAPPAPRRGPASRWPTCWPWPARGAAPRTPASRARTCARRRSPSQRFGGSIPLDKACRPEVLLAWAMNGEPLAPVHGAPLRVVVPGYIGARSVKWLERIEVRDAPWKGYFQEVVYRLLAEDGVPGPGVGHAARPRRAQLRRPGARRRRDRAGRRRSRCAATRSPAASATSRASTSRSTARRAGCRRSCSRTRAAGRGASGGPWSSWRPGEHELVVRAWDSSAANPARGRGRLWNPRAT